MIVLEAAQMLNANRTGLPAETIRRSDSRASWPCMSPRWRYGSSACRIISCMAAVPEPSLILSFEEARHLVEDHAAQLRPRGKELVELLEGAGQVLAEPIVADRNFPPFPRAMRDGYAVRAADLSPLPATLEVIGEIKAGARAEDVPTLQPGQAAAIMTGAPAPPGSDAVVMVEYTSRDAGRVQIMKPVAAGDNIAPGCLGGETRRALAVSGSAARLRRDRRGGVGGQRAGCWSTASPKSRFSLPATKSSTLMFRLRATRSAIRTAIRWRRRSRRPAASPCCCPSLPTSLQRLRELIADGLEADLLLLAGGVSMGKYDLVEPSPGRIPGRIFLHRRANSAGKAGGVWPGPVWPRAARPRTAGVCTGACLFLRPAGKSRIDNGDL